jgi:hypothetical protein
MSKRQLYYIYLEYQSSACPFVRIGSPRPLSRKRVCPPHLEPKAEGQHSLAGVGGGGS